MAEKVAADLVLSIGKISFSSVFSLVLTMTSFSCRQTIYQLIGSGGVALWKDL